MNLGDLITALEAADQTRPVAHGFGNPHSYRGDYMDLAFEPVDGTTVGAMLAAARSAVDATFQGWKGGDFTMGTYSWCWLSVEGEASGETISPQTLAWMLTAAPAPVSVPADAVMAVADAEQASDLVTALRGAGAERDKIEAQRYKQERAAALRAAADEIAGIDFHPNARARSLDIAAGLARRLRRMADEEQPATEACPQCRDTGACNGGPCPLLPQQPAAVARQDGAES